MFDYFKKERAGIIKAFEDFSSDEFDKSRGLSFDSIRGVFVHTIMVEENWLHYRLAGKGEGTSKKLEDFKNLSDIKKYMTEVDAKTTSLFNRITLSDIKKEIKRPRPDGKEDVYTVETILYHLPIEIIHHYGEIFSEFWKMNINAPYYPYLLYVRDKNASK